MTLMRWDPFTELRRMEEDMNRLWRSFPGDGGSEAWAVPLDVVEKGDNIVVHASIPGVNPDDINVTVENNMLTIRAETKEEKERKDGDYLMRERRFGSFYRSMRLPDTGGHGQGPDHVRAWSVDAVLLQDGVQAG